MGVLPVQAFQLEKCRKSLLDSYDVRELFAALQTAVLPFIVTQLKSARENPQVEIAEALMKLESFLRELVGQNVLYDTDIDCARTEAQRLKQNSLTEMAELMFLLAHLLESHASEQIPDSGCDFELHSAKCSQCGNEAVYKRWIVVNTTLRPELRQDGLKGLLTAAPACSYCQESLNIFSPFIYCDPTRGEYLIFFPWDDPDYFDEVLNGCFKYLELSPATLKGNTTYAAYYEGFAPWTGAHSDCAMIFRIYSPESFIKILAEDIFYDSHSYLDPNHILVYRNVQWLFERGNYKEAARLTAEAFLKDQTQVEFLRTLALTLDTLSEKELARRIQIRAGDLLKELRRYKIYQDIRFGSPVEHSTELVKIWQQGLPSEWGFDDLIIEVRSVLERYVGT
jgi:CpXC protein